MASLTSSSFVGVRLAPPSVPTRIIPARPEITTAMAQGKEIAQRVAGGIAQRASGATQALNRAERAVSSAGNRAAQAVGRGQAQAKGAASSVRQVIMRPPGLGANAREFLGLEKEPTKPFFGFTKNNELFVGRLAMVGVAAALLGEWLTGAGPLQQLNIEVGLPVDKTQPLVIALVAFNAIAALAPTSGGFVADSSLDGREEGSLQNPNITLANPVRFFGLNRRQLFGFTKENELRIAQLGFAAALIGESLTGKGILAQLNMETGLPLAQAPWWLGGLIAFWTVAAVGGLGGRGRFTEEDEGSEEED